jgi:hypothetical protein
VEPTLQALFALLTTFPVSSPQDQATPSPVLDGDWRRDQARASSSQLWLDRSISPAQHFVGTTVAGMSSGIRVGARRGARRGLDLRARVTLTRVVFELRF